MSRPFARQRTFNGPIMAHQKSITNKKLLAEADYLLNFPVPGCEAAPRDDDLMIWTSVIEGPSGSLYEGGNFFVQFRFDDNYPFTPPVIIFLTRIYHCNIDSEGRINLPLTSTNWTSCKNIAEIMRAIQQLLRQCNPDSPILPELAEQYLKERDKYEMMAKEWTKRYAH